MRTITRSLILAIFILMAFQFGALQSSKKSVKVVEVQASPSLSSNIPDLVERILPSVVNISSTTVINYRNRGWDDFLDLWGVPAERKNTSLGSGFIIDKEGFILTNYHVVAQADEVMVTMADNSQFNAKIIGRDPKMDLALLQMRDAKGKTPERLFPAKLGNSDLVRIAEPALAIGNPMGLQHSVSMGIISAKNRTIGVGPFDDFLQTDAAINPGNSGGPLFNLNGEVIGINTLIFSRTGQSGGLGFAIPSNEAVRILNDLKFHGRVPRPWLGILSEQLTPGLRYYYRIASEEGVLVYNLVRAAPAHRAGLQQGDVIISINKEKVLQPNDIEKILAKERSKGKIELQIQRGRKKMELTVKLEELPGNFEELPKGII